MPISQQNAKRGVIAPGVNLPEPPDLFTNRLSAEERQKAFEVWYYSLRQAIQQELDKKVDKAGG